MLELQSLILRPPAGPGPLLEIADTATGVPAGRVYRRTPSSLWQRWLRPCTLAVHEADDDPLLCTVSGPRPFWPRWHVRDADANTVGFLRPASAERSPSNKIGEIFDPLDRLLAVLRSSEEEDRFLDLTGAELARVRRSSEAVVEVAFGRAVCDDPLVKMLVLAAVVMDALPPVGGAARC